MFYCPDDRPTRKPRPQEQRIGRHEEDGCRRNACQALSRKPGHIGALAFSRTGDPSSGDFGDAKVIRKFGEVPEDLSTL